MYKLQETTRFKKDIKRAKKRNLDMQELDEVVTALVRTGKLSEKYKPHKLKGDYEGFWECHIKPDWLLVWAQDNGIKLITLTRTGTHADLF